MGRPSVAWATVPGSSLNEPQEHARTLCSRYAGITIAVATSNPRFSACAAPHKWLEAGNFYSSDKTANGDQGVLESRGEEVRQDAVFFPNGSKSQM